MVPTSGRWGRESPASGKPVNATATPKCLEIAHWFVGTQPTACWYHGEQEFGEICVGFRVPAYIVPHNRKGLVVLPACAAAPVGGRPVLMSGWGMEAGMPMFGIIWPMGPRGAIPVMGTIETGPPGGSEERGKGSLLLWIMLLKPWALMPIMGLTLIWLRVGGWGWFTWKGFTWAAGAGARAGAGAEATPEAEMTSRREDFKIKLLRLAWIILILHVHSEQTNTTNTNQWLAVH